MPEYPKSGAILFAANARKLAAFYREVAQLRVLTAEEEHVVLENETFRLTVHQIPPPYVDDIAIRVPPEVREDAAIKLSFPVDSIGLAREAAARLGGCVYGEDREWVWALARVCDGWDGEGNVFQVWERVG